MPHEKDMVIRVKIIPENEEAKAVFAAAAGSSASDVYESLDKEAWEIVGLLASYGSSGHWGGDVEKLMLRANEWRAKVRQAMPTNGVSQTAGSHIAPARKPNL